MDLSQLNGHIWLDGEMVPWQEAPRSRADAYLSLRSGGIRGGGPTRPPAVPPFFDSANIPTGCFAQRTSCA